MQVWRRFFRGRSLRESDLEREVRDHLELEAEEQHQAGVASQRAHLAARREFGNTTLVKEDVRSTWRFASLETLVNDFRYALRILRRNPGFSAIAVMALALGIGANTAVFSVFNAVVLRPLPFAEPQRLVRVWESFGTPGNENVVSYPNFVDWRAWNHTFSDLAAYSSSSAVLTGSGEPVQLRGLIASASLFPVLGVQPSVGRNFLPEEDRPAANGGDDSVIISSRLWNQRFGSDPGVLGRRLMLDGKPYAVVGVMPPRFDAGVGTADQDYWMTVAVLARPSGRSRPVSEERTMSFLNTIGRLRPGVSLGQAQADMDSVAAALVRAHKDDDPNEGVILKGLQESSAGSVRPVLMLLLAVAGGVFLIACADVGGLVLARANGRRREITVRSAIGAGRWRIARQLLVESLVLAGIGCGVGLALASTVGQLLSQVLDLTRLGAPVLDVRVFVFAGLAATVAAVVFSLGPSIELGRADLMQGLRESAHSTSDSPRQRRLHSALVVVQIALAMVLLSSSGLLTLSLVRLQNVDLGFEPKHALTLAINLPGERYAQNRRALFFGDLISRLESLPSVQAAGAGSQMPIIGCCSRTAVSNVGGQEIPVSKRTGIAFSSITPHYFKAMGIAVAKGREFTERDSAGAPPVVILNEAAARRYFGSRDPLGQQIVPGMWNGSGSTTQSRTVVGIVKDVKVQGGGHGAVSTIFWPIAQIPSDSSLHVVLRTAGNPFGVLSAVGEQIHILDKDLPLYQVQSLEEVVGESMSQPRHTAVLVGIFAALALVLTAVGLYGVIAYSVACRTREIGIRMAIGATEGEVLRGFLGHGLVLSGAGVAIGVAGSIGAAKLLRTLLFGVAGQQPVMFAAGAVLLIVVALAASYVPARRAARIDPMLALRLE